MTVSHEERPAVAGRAAPTLEEVTDSLLYDDKVVTWLQLADDYIQLYNDNPIGKTK